MVVGMVAIGRSDAVEVAVGVNVINSSSSSDLIHR